jgi:hypothetical protein
MRAGLDQAVLNRNVIRYWTHSILNRPVKLTSLQRPPMFWTEGYVTCYKFVAGRTLGDAERILGLKAGELGGGAYFYELARLPTTEEFATRGYTQTPDGIPWDPSSEYPIGAGAAQWEIYRNTYIPSRLIGIIHPGERVG